MGDALSESVPFAYLEHEILRAVASEAGRVHRWLWLTKWPDRMGEFLAWAIRMGWKWPSNLWIGTIITTRKSLPRVRHLAAIGDDENRVMRFLSIEPQSEEVDVTPWLESVHWVIQGGESGDEPLAFDLAWARRTRDACQRHSVPYFLKQLGRVVTDDGKPVQVKRRRVGIGASGR